MRSQKLLIAGLAMCAGVLGQSGHALPQSFLQEIFGTGEEDKAPPPAAAAAASQPRAQVTPPFRLLQRDQERASRPRAPDAGADEDIGPPDSGGPYTTMCVRTCDGFYFPLRANARRANFVNDARSCKAACGSDARLFYYPARSGDTAAMVDLSGQSYADLPHAFAYRKALKDGCTCKPVPWSEDAKAEHQKYAGIEARELEKDKAFAAGQQRVAEAQAALLTAKAVEMLWPARDEDKNQVLLAMSWESEPSGVAGMVIVKIPETKVAAMTVEEQSDAARLAEIRASLPPRRFAEAPRVERERARWVTRKAAYQATSWPLFSPGKTVFRYPGDPR